jgi:glutathione S-transferase
MLLLYGVPVSQPTRAVLWALLMKRVPFELKFTMPRSSKPGGALHPEYLERLHPFGQVPCLDDDGFVLYEAAAILCYLADRHQWGDLYPTDLQQRARVNQYLHFHHSNTRLLTMHLFRPIILGRHDPAPDPATVPQVMAKLETLTAKDAFLCGPAPTLADLMAYSEVGQLLPHYTNLLDPSPWPNVHRWAQRMAALPEHDAAHEGLVQFLPRFREMQQASASPDRAKL